MRVLGIDPGIGRTGWGVIDMEKNVPKAEKFGCIETFQTERIEQRLQFLYKNMCEIVTMHKPDVVSVEELFFNTNTKTALVVGQARGVILLAAALKDIPVVVYTPLQVKMAVTGYGRAEKKQIGQMVKTLLSLKVIPRPDDISDALANALTHAFSAKHQSYVREGR